MHGSSEGSKKYKSLELLNAKALGMRAVCVWMEGGRLGTPLRLQNLCLGEFLNVTGISGREISYFMKDWFCLGLTASVFRVHGCGTDAGDFVILFSFNESLILLS